MPVVLPIRYLCTDSSYSSRHNDPQLTIVLHFRLFLFEIRAVTVCHRPERLIAWNFGEQLVVVILVL